MIFDMKLKEKYTLDKYTDNEAYIETDQEYCTMFNEKDAAALQGKDDKKKYISNGRTWKKYHALWSKENMINFWDFKK